MPRLSGKTADCQTLVSLMHARAVKCRGWRQCVSSFPRSWTSNPVRLGTKGRLKARFAAVRARIAEGPPQRIKDKCQQHLAGEEVKLIGEHRNSGETKYEDRQRGPRDQQLVNPFEENRTTDRSRYLDQYSVGGCAWRGGW
jgi:hypothetical protein